MITLSDLTIQMLPHAVSLPVYATDGAAGADLHAAVPAKPDGTAGVVFEEEWTLAPGARRMIPTGLKMKVPEGHYVEIVSRSGLTAKQGIVVLNAPGVIDSDYRGEVCVILANLGDQPFVIKRGERIAQILLKRYVQATFLHGTVDDDTARGSGGFGSTGTK